MKLLLLALLAADPNVVEVFKDKGDTFIRAGTNKGLKVGSEVTILGDKIGDSDEYRAGGKAAVLEVFETLARISPDEEAKKLKEIKLARISSSAPAPKPAGTTASAEPKLSGLKGHAEFGGIGPAKRISIFNDGSGGWTGCEIRLPNNKHYKLAELKGGEHEGIALIHFDQDGTELDRPLDNVVVKCAQGSAKWNFGM